LNPATAGTG